VGDEGSSAQLASWKGAGRGQRTLHHGTAVVTPAPGQLRVPSICALVVLIGWRSHVAHPILAIVIRLAKANPQWRSDFECGYQR
jgi:hypothetical protein